MSERITEKMLERLCDLINQETGSPMASYVKGADGKYHAQVGNYHLSHAYGGVNLCRMSNTSGGISNVFSCGHVPKRDLYNRMHALLAGLRIADDIKKSA